MKLLVLAGLLAASAMTAVQASPATDNTGQRSPTNYDPQVPTTSDRQAPTNVGDTPQVEGYTDQNRYSRTGQGEYFSGNPMRVAGRVVGDSNRFVNRKLHVDVNGQRWTINAPDNVFSLGQNGERLSVHDLHEGDWVVAEGNQIGDMRIRALAIRKLGDDFSDYQRSVFFQPKHTGGYAINITAGPDFRMQARESIMGVQSQVAGERQETGGSPKK